ncbi:ribosome biogenesis protein WDR12 [Lingula anatina]|uniref:Ribosome biogenesis protein WDR12 homolog n=1 Tax=Lingula anatina TaxID=7574 RepID=A0A1S3ILR3_LINAN|nr:ribosome biogenesis protein WDR12 [Lingula anatina]|eukprot:XP_013399023.1 ribosome biogenesis protein WDR12 [Lingula anatina]
MAAPSSNNVPHVQAKFFTKQPQFAVPDTPFSIPASVGQDELTDLINGILQTESQDVSSTQFDFLINGEYLRVPLDKHMEQKEISTETVVEIEYLERHPAPEPQDSLLHDDWVSCVRGSGNYILSGSYDNTLRMWNFKGESLITIPGHSGPVKAVAWVKQDDDPVSLFLSASHDQTVLIWEWNKNKNSVDCVQMCRGHTESVDCLAVDSSKTKFCSGSWDKMLKIWSAIPSSEDESTSQSDGERLPKKKKTDSKIPNRTPLMTFSGHNEGVSAVTWSGDSEICTASWDHTIKFWDLEQAAQKSSITGTKVFLDISYSSVNGLLIAGSSDRHIRLYDPRSTEGTVVKSTFTSHNGWVPSVCWSTTNQHQFLSGSYDHLVKLWDTRSPKAPLFDMSGHEDKVLSVDWTVPDYLLSGGADNHLKVFRHTKADS